MTDAYLDTIARMEPEIASVDAAGAYASIAISLKRIADALDEALAIIKRAEAEARAADER